VARWGLSKEERRESWNSTNLPWKEDTGFFSLDTAHKTPLDEIRSMHKPQRMAHLGCPIVEVFLPKWTDQEETQ